MKPGGSNIRINCVTLKIAFVIQQLWDMYMYAHFKKCNISANNYRVKKKVSVPVFNCRPQYFFWSYRKHTHTHNKKRSMPGPRRMMFFVVFFNLRVQCLVSVKGNMLPGDMVKKITLGWLTSPKNCRTHLEDSHGSAQICHRATTHNSGAFSLPV